MQKEITTAHGRKLIVVEIPKGFSSMNFYEGQLWLDDEAVKFDEFYDNVKIIGTLHYNNDGQPVFDFDCEPFVERRMVYDPDNIPNKKDANTLRFINHLNITSSDPEKSFTDSKEDSFLSLLHSYGIGFKENPMGEKPKEEDYIKHIYGSQEHMYECSVLAHDVEAWQKAEEGVLRLDKKLVFIEVKP